MWHEGMGWTMIFGGLWMVVFWGGLIALIIWGVTKLTQRNGSTTRRDSLDINFIIIVRYQVYCVRYWGPPTATRGSSTRHASAPLTWSRRVGTAIPR